MELHREFRDIPLWVAQDYIRDLPDAVEVDGGFSGPDWRIELQELPEVPVGALRFRRTSFRLSGAEEVVTRVWESLEHKFYRGGA